MASVLQLLPQTVLQTARRAFLRGLAPSLGLAASLGLAGCGIGTVTTATDVSLALTGNVHGGMQPVTGAAIQLYAAGTAGNGSAATPLLTNPVLTDGQSNFVVTTAVTCPAASTPVYLVARGGNPGFSTNTNNPALVLMAALGPCGALANGGLTVRVNEVTTVAAAYALAQFTASADHIGASAHNSTGITNAFANAHLLADPTTGLATILPSALSTETGKLYALADALVPCVNSDGGRACAPLFSATTANGVAPADVFSALVNIVKHPGTNVAAVYGAIPSTPPFATTLTSTPSDWTMSLRVSGGGLVEPTALAVDGAGNVWVTNYGDRSAQKPSGIVAYSPQGTPLAGSPFGVGVQTDAYGLALDRNGDVWVTSYDNVQGGGNTGSVAKFLGAGSSTPGAFVFQSQDSSLSYPFSIATDPNGSGTVLVNNYLSGTVSVFDLSGHLTSVLGASVDPRSRSAFPITVSSDNAGGAWLGSQSDHWLTHLLADGTSLQATCCNGVFKLALDPHGNVWAPNYFAVGADQAYTFSEVAPNGTVLINEQQGGGVYRPSSGAVDAGGQFWIANYTSSNASLGGADTFSEVAGNDSGLTPGTPLSPATGFGRDAKVTGVYAVALDASGDLWMTGRQDNSLHMFFGLATPTATPATPIPQAP